MKANLSGKIKSIQRLDSGEALLSVVLDGKTQPTDEERRAAKQLPRIKSDIALRLPQLVADELRFGQTLYFKISDEEEV